jgi:hypothetical protein
MNTVIHTVNRRQRWTGAHTMPFSLQPCWGTPVHRARENEMDMAEMSVGERHKPAFEEDIIRFRIALSRARDYFAPVL